MSDLQHAVRAFHRAFKLPVGDYAKPSALDEERGKLRYDMLYEELVELWAALKDGDLVAQADALGDILYLALGGFVELGVDSTPVFWAIHDSNRSKLGADGAPVLRGDGKVLKGPGYFPPKIAEAIQEQIEEEARLAEMDIPF